MNPAKLTKMANEIAAFFDADPDRNAALDGFTGHLRRFWEPRMRKELVSWIDGHGGEGCAPLVLQAFAERRGQILPEPV